MCVRSVVREGLPDLPETEALPGFPTFRAPVFPAFLCEAALALLFCTDPPDFPDDLFFSDVMEDDLLIKNSSYVFSDVCGLKRQTLLLQEVRSNPRKKYS